MRDNKSVDRGLAPFDEPVYLEHAGHESAATAPPDERPTPVLAFLCRSCLLAALCAALPFLSDDDLRVVVAISVATHLSATTILELTRVDAARSRRQLLSFTLSCLDVAVIITLALAAGRGVVLSTLGPLTIAFHRWMYGRRAAAGSVVLTTAALVACVLVGTEDVDWFVAVAVATVGALLVWLVDDQAVRHSAASAGLHLVANRAEAVLEGIGDAIVSTDGHGRIAGVNPAAAQLLRCTPDGAQGRHCHDALALQTDAGPLDCTDGCALLSGDGQSVEVRRRGAGGGNQPLLATAVALRNPDGDVVEVVHLLRDISDLKQADDAKTLFLATASHELKTPLAVISGYAQILGMPTVAPEDREAALHAITARATQLTNIVDRLLMSSRIDAGHIDLLLRPIPIGELLRDQTAAFSAAARTVDLAVEDDLPHAWTEHAALETVIDHLLENAHKYSPGNASIRVRAHADDDHVHVAVRDSGIGMTQAQMDLCFERFWQAEGTDVRRFGGTGIGLYIVKSLVQAMGGRVSVRANDDVGVTFTVTLRRRPPATVPDVVDSPVRSTDGEESMIREFMRQVGVLTPEEVDR